MIDMLGKPKLLCEWRKGVGYGMVLGGVFLGIVSRYDTYVGGDVGCCCVLDDCFLTLYLMLLGSGLHTLSYGHLQGQVNRQ